MAMTTIPIKIAGELEANVADIPEQPLELIKSALTIWNEDREKKLNEKIFGAWDEPEWIPLWRIQKRRDGSEILTMPRGFASQLAAGLAQFECEIAWNDQRSRVEAPEGYYTPFLMRDYQVDAALKMLQAEQGVYEAPAGSGKTTTILGLLAYANLSAVVVVERANLLEQWRARAAHFLGLSLDLDEEFSVGKIGEDVWVERPLTIALRQTLFSRLWEIDALDWFGKRGAVIIDECHHSASETNGDVLSRARTQLLLGVSATPAKSETRGKIVYSRLGPIVAQTTRHELYERGVLMEPTIEAIYTGHDDEFWVTHDAERVKDSVTGQITWACQVPNCRKAGTSHGHRNNYASVLKRLVENVDRNRLIAERIVSERGHIHLVASSQLKHLELLHSACIEAGWDGPTFMLRGKENEEGLSEDISNAVIGGGFWEVAKRREGRRVIKFLQKTANIDPERGRECIIFSTVADEGLDIPPIDRTHIVFPMRQEGAIIQLIGRGERIAEGKRDTVIVDYRDRCVVFAEQALERHRVFSHQGFKTREVQLEH